MENKYEIRPVGKVVVKEDGFFVELFEEYRKAIKELDGFSHVDIVWWADMFDSDKYRKILTVKKPYRKAPENMGVFATRSQIRPNLIAITVCGVLKIDHETGLIRVNYIDAENGTPILDIKPYHPSTDRIKNVSVPQWCDHWPSYYEDSGEFDWESEFLFER